MKKKSNWQIILILIILLGLFWRLKWWPNEVTFGYEQARDAMAAQELFAGKKFTLIGPTTEIEGLFHGPIYYYFIGLPYHLFGKNPASVSLTHLLANLLSLPIIFWVGKKLFNPRVGIIAAFLYAISFEVASYSLWLSNPSPGLPLIILTYYLFYLGLTEKEKYLPWACFLLGLTVQWDLIIVMQLIPILVFAWLIKKKLSLKEIFVSGLAFLAPLSTYPLFEVRHDFLMTRKFFEVLASQDADFRNIFEYLWVYLSGLAREFANVLLPIHGFFAGVLMLVLLCFLWQKLKAGKKKEKKLYLFITIWLFSTAPVFLITAAVTNSEFSFFGVSAAIALLTASFISELWKKKKLWLAGGILLVILLANLRAWKTYFPDPMRKLFDAQRGLILKDALGVIDYTYEQAGGKSFYVETITVPLYISPLWDYLYSWYGVEKYGYLPEKDREAEIQFLVIEPGWGDTYQIFRQKDVADMDQRTKVEEEQKFGMILVEKRSLLEKELP